METEKTRQERLRKWLDLQNEERKQRLNKRFGTPINKTTGNSSFDSSSVAPDDAPDGEASSATEDEKEKLKAPLGNGDEVEKFKLYDCETGEEVTVDGMGGNGAEPSYPTGFEDCKEQETDPTYQEGWVWVAYYQINGVTQQRTYWQTQSSANAWLNPFYSCPSGQSSCIIKDQLNSGSFAGQADYTVRPDNGLISCNRSLCSGLTDPAAIAVCELPPPTPQWPAVDKNHLVFDKESGCFKPLCPEYNNQVLPKFQGCEEELILCDEDGNKQKVKVNEDGSIDVTQSQFNQTATIKNGKVVSVKKLTETQKEKEFE